MVSRVIHPCSLFYFDNEKVTLSLGLNKAKSVCVQQDLTASQEAIAKGIREDTDAHRRKMVLEEHVFQKLLENSQMGSRRTPRVRVCRAWLTWHA